MHINDLSVEKFQWREGQIFELTGVPDEFDAGPAIDELPDEMREKNDKGPKRPE
jgi:hypothetical protein